MVEFIQADLAVHRALLADLNEEHLGWIVSHLQKHYGIDAMSIVHQTVREYAERSIDEIAAFVPPDGIFYLLKEGGSAVGMGGLRKVREGVGEIKRMYVKPEHRGKGLGRALMQQLLDKGKEFGFSSILLETGKFMTAAQHLYRSVGFKERAEYPGTEVPPELRHVWLFMEKSI